MKARSFRDIFFMRSPAHLRWRDAFFKKAFDAEVVAEIEALVGGPVEQWDLEAIEVAVLTLHKRARSSHRFRQATAIKLRFRAETD